MGAGGGGNGIGLGAAGAGVAFEARPEFRISGPPAAPGVEVRTGVAVSTGKNHLVQTIRWGQTPRQGGRGAAPKADRNRSQLEGATPRRAPRGASQGPWGTLAIQVQRNSI